MLIKSELLNDNPWYLENNFYTNNSYIVNPITWKYLKETAICVYGLNDLNVKITNNDVIKYCHENINTYWKNWVNQTEKSAVHNLSELTAIIEWGVLGITRLHATIFTGKIISKLDAGFYAKNIFDKKWNKVLDFAINIRKFNTIRSYAVEILSD
ncbi:MAG: hypothetical protein WBQ05_13845 [Candidatus Competibacter denitrificans]